MPGFSDIADELIQHGTSTLCEASGVNGALDTALRPIWPGATIVGAALPVRCSAGDNLAIHLAVAQASPGNVLVVDGQQYIGGYWGEILTVAAQQRNIAGLVIDGGVRDIAALEKRRFPVFARGVGMRACVKVSAPPASDTVVVAGVCVTRGDLIVADADGVCAIPAALVDKTLAATRDRTKREAAIIQRLEAGETTVEILGLVKAR